MAFHPDLPRVHLLATDLLVALPQLRLCLHADFQAPQVVEGLVTCDPTWGNYGNIWRNYGETNWETMGKPTKDRKIWKISMKSPNYNYMGWLKGKTAGKPLNT